VDFGGDFYYSALGLKRHFQNQKLNRPDRAALLRDALQLPGRWRLFAPPGKIHDRPKFARRHSRDSDRAAVSYHDDLSNEFYRLWLDGEMVYSCAYFESIDDTLEQAQRNELDDVCRKLRLSPGERFLDIGCGWGARVR